MSPQELCESFFDELYRGHQGKLAQLVEQGQFTAEVSGCADHELRLSGLCELFRSLKAAFGDLGQRKVVDHISFVGDTMVAVSTMTFTHTGAYHSRDGVEVAATGLTVRLRWVEMLRLSRHGKVSKFVVVFNEADLLRQLQG